MVSRRKQHKNAQIRAAKQRKHDKENMKRWREEQNKWTRKSRIKFYLQLLFFIICVIAFIFLLFNAIMEALNSVF